MLAYKWLVAAGLAIFVFVVAMVVRDYEETAPPIIPPAPRAAE
jgi:hypothetical protein